MTLLSNSIAYSNFSQSWICMIVWHPAFRCVTSLIFFKYFVCNSKSSRKFDNYLFDSPLIKSLWKKTSHFETIPFKLQINQPPLTQESIQKIKSQPRKLQRFINQNQPTVSLEKSRSRYPILSIDNKRKAHNKRIILLNLSKNKLRSKLQPPKENNILNQ